MTEKKREAIFESCFLTGYVEKAIPFKFLLIFYWCSLFAHELLDVYI